MVMNVTKAPFTKEQVENLNSWQKAGYVHPFTCGTKEKHSEGRSENLIATENGWVCPSCDYKQEWADPYRADFPPPLPENMRK